MLNKIIFNIPTSNRPSDTRRRYIKKVDENNKTLPIGSLYLDYNQDEDNQSTYAKLEPNEIIQCKELISVYNKMRRCLDTTNQSFKAQTIYWDDKFADMLYEIAELSQGKGINFMPKDTMFEALLTKLNHLEHELDLPPIYEKYGFTPSYKRPLLMTRFQQKQHIVQAFLELDDDKDQLMLIFNDYLHDRLGIAKTFTYKMLLELTENYQNTENDTPKGLRSYILSACIDIMDSYGVNPCEQHDPGLVFYFWYNPRLKQYNSHQAIKQFVAKFEPPEHKMDRVYLALTDIISKPILPNHVYLNI